MAVSRVCSERREVYEAFHWAIDAKGNEDEDGSRGGRV